MILSIATPPVCAGRRCVLVCARQTAASLCLPNEHRAGRFPSIANGLMAGWATLRVLTCMADDTGEKRPADPAPRMRQSAARLEQSAGAVEQSTEKLVDTADRRTQLAADRTVLAAERTYAAWVRTGLAALASGIGAKKLLEGMVPNWMTIVAGSLLI